MTKRHAAIFAKVGDSHGIGTAQFRSFASEFLEAAKVAGFGTKITHKTARRIAHLYLCKRETTCSSCRVIARSVSEDRASSASSLGRKGITK